MKILIAGATGVMGRPLTKQILNAGHKVLAMTRSEPRAMDLQQQGATPVICDAFDRETLQRCLAETRPDVVINQLTALPKRINPRKLKTQLALTNRLRTVGTQNLFDAALEAGAKQFISQSIAFAYRPEGKMLKTEDCALFDNAPASFGDVPQAVRNLEQTTLSRSALPGIVLRYGFFYGPGTAYASDGSVAADVLNRRMPIAGKGLGIFSFVHVEDAAAATVAALRHKGSGIFNIVDNDPAPVADWLPVYAEALHARRPRHVPRWLVRLLAGPYAIYMMCDQPGASNAKAKEALGWELDYPTWRTGFDAAMQANRPTMSTGIKSSQGEVIREVNP